MRSHQTSHSDCTVFDTLTNSPLPRLGRIGGRLIDRHSSKLRYAIEELENRKLLSATIYYVDSSGWTQTAGSTISGTGPFTVNVNAINIGFQNDTLTPANDSIQTASNSADLTANNYLWNFGDQNSSYNTLPGFNASHLYQNPGTYTLSLAVTTPSGTSTASTNVIVATRSPTQSYYVSSSSGAHGNSGTSSSAPFQNIVDLQDALDHLSSPDNTNIYFCNADTIPDAGFILRGNNMLVSTYGSGSTAPLLLDDQLLGTDSLHHLTANQVPTIRSLIAVQGSNDTVAGVSLGQTVAAPSGTTTTGVPIDNGSAQGIYGTDSLGSAYIYTDKNHLDNGIVANNVHDATHPIANLTVLNCTFGDLGDGLLSDSSSVNIGQNGLLMQGCQAPLPTNSFKVGLSAYFAFDGYGDNWSLLGNSDDNSFSEHDLRFDGGPNISHGESWFVGRDGGVLIAYNKLYNPILPFPNVTRSSDTNKNVVDLRVVCDAYVYQNELDHGTAGVGYGNDKLKDVGAYKNLDSSDNLYSTWQLDQNIVYDSNFLNHATFRLSAGLQYVTLKENIINLQGDSDQTVGTAAIVLSALPQPYKSQLSSTLNPIYHMAIDQNISIIANSCVTTGAYTGVTFPEFVTVKNNWSSISMVANLFSVPTGFASRANAGGTGAIMIDPPPINDQTTSPTSNTNYGPSSAYAYAPNPWLTISAITTDVANQWQPFTSGATTHVYYDDISYNVSTNVYTFYTYLSSVGSTDSVAAVKVDPFSDVLVTSVSTVTPSSPNYPQIFGVLSDIYGTPITGSTLIPGAAQFSGTSIPSPVRDDSVGSFSGSWTQTANGGAVGSSYSSIAANQLGIVSLTLVAPVDGVYNVNINLPVVSNAVTSANVNISYTDSNGIFQSVSTTLNEAVLASGYITLTPTVALAAGCQVSVTITSDGTGSASNVVVADAVKLTPQSFTSDPSTPPVPFVSTGVGLSNPWCNWTDSNTISWFDQANVGGYLLQRSTYSTFANGSSPSFTSFVFGPGTPGGTTRFQDFEVNNSTTIYYYRVVAFNAYSISNSHTLSATSLPMDVFKGSSGGSWSVAANWTAGVVPTSSYLAVLPGGQVLANTSDILSGSSLIPHSIVLNGGSLLLSYVSGSDPFSSISLMIAAGFDSGAWDGIGINSAAAAAEKSGLYGIGYADGADSVVSGLGATQILLRPTIVGDVNLDGICDYTDSTILTNSSNFSHTGTTWDRGDINYDGSTNFADYQDLLLNFLLRSQL